MKRANLTYEKVKSAADKIMIGGLVEWEPISYNNANNYPIELQKKLMRVTGKYKYGFEVDPQLRHGRKQFITYIEFARKDGYIFG